QILAVDVASRLAVDDEQVVSSRASGNVDGLPHFDISFGSQNETSFVAKRSQAIRSQPIHAKISKTAIAVDHHVAEVLELRAMAEIHICHLRHRRLDHRGSGEVDELVGLVRAKVAESAAVAHRIPEPFGSDILVDPMRSQLDRL